MSLREDLHARLDAWLDSLKREQNAPGEPYAGKDITNCALTFHVPMDVQWNEDGSSYVEIHISEKTFEEVEGSL